MPDPEAPEADALEQAQDVDDELLPHELTDDPEVPLADAAEQAQVVPDDEE